MFLKIQLLTATSTIFHNLFFFTCLEYYGISLLCECWCSDWTAVWLCLSFSISEFPPRTSPGFCAHMIPRFQRQNDDCWTKQKTKVLFPQPLVIAGLWCVRSAPHKTLADMLDEQDFLFTCLCSEIINFITFVTPMIFGFMASLHSSIV